MERVLEDFRILDLTRVVAGPFATAVLADLGAEVIKVERPGTGDDYRYGPSLKGKTSLSFQNTNRGKQSITLDLRTEEGRSLFCRLAAEADAVVENFRAGWLESQGLGAERLHGVNPSLVIASLSGFGQTGPRAGEASYDIVAQAAGGFLAMTGFAEGSPVRGGGALADYIGGLFLAVGLVAGVHEARRTGRGRVLDVSNQDAVFAITDSWATIAAGLGVEAERTGNQHPFTAPYDCFEALDGHVVVASASNKLFRQLCDGIGRPELASDERFRSHRGRATHRREINAVVQEWIRPLRCEEVLQRLGPAGADLPCARVSRPDELLTDPQLVARGMIERHAHPDPEVGEVVFHGNPVQFSGAGPRERALAPDLGEDNAAVFGRLGLSAEDLQRLARDGVV